MQKTVTVYYAQAIESQDHIFIEGDRVAEFLAIPNLRFHWVFPGDGEWSAGECDLIPADIRLNTSDGTCTEFICWRESDTTSGVEHNFPQSGDTLTYDDGVTEPEGPEPPPPWIPDPWPPVTPPDPPPPEPPVLPPMPPPPSWPASDGKPIHIGSKSIAEDISKYSFVMNNEGVVCSRTWHGPLADILAAKYFIGMSMTDVPHAPRIDEKHIAQPAPGRGEMTLIARRSGESLGAAYSGLTEPTTYELEWGALEKPLLAHPRYAAVLGIANAAGSTLADYIAEWRLSDVKRRAEIAAEVVSFGGSAGAIFAEITGKLSAGVESFLLPAPVARTTTVSYTRPATSAMGKKQTPPNFPSLPSGYEWLCTADRCMRAGKSGKWQRSQEWTGAEKWDNDLYQ